jgi:predicted RNase H-like HicB family nuclease
LNIEHSKFNIQNRFPAQPMETPMRLKLTEELWKEGSMYVSYCPELDIASCGETVDQAKKNLKEVILINLEESKKLGSLDKLLQEAGFDELQGVLTLRKELVGFTPIEVAI